MDTIAKITRLAVLATEGVARLTSPLDVIVMPRAHDTFDVDIYLIVKFGYKIPEVAWDVQENVKKSLLAEGINNVEQINIHIQGVSFEGKK
jgi:uncharacterized alkaline shock family protein YloU